MTKKESDRKERQSAKSFEDLVFWQKAHEAVLLVYKLTRGFPSDEKFGLTNPFRRVSISIAANIAEGFIERSELDKIRYVNIAQGSLEECKYILILSGDLSYSFDSDLTDLFDEIGKMLNGYISKIKSKFKILTYNF